MSIAAAFDRARPPERGDAVDLPDGGRAVYSDDYGPGVVGICRLEDVYGGGFFFGPSYGPPVPGEEVRDHVSVSGGPIPGVELARFRPTGETVEVRCWHWQDRPRAGGAVYYQRRVRLWRLVHSERQKQEARTVLERARAALGAELGGGSPVDLLLDNMTEGVTRLSNSADARGLLQELGELPAEPRFSLAEEG